MKDRTFFPNGPLPEANVEVFGPSNTWELGDGTWLRSSERYYLIEYLCCRRKDEASHATLKGRIKKTERTGEPALCRWCAMKKHSKAHALRKAEAERQRCEAEASVPDFAGFAPPSSIRRGGSR